MDGNRVSPARTSVISVPRPPWHTLLALDRAALLPVRGLPGGVTSSLSDKHVLNGAWFPKRWFEMLPSCSMLLEQEIFI